MPIMEWFNSFELGIKEIDNDHKHLVDLLNRVFDSFISAENHETIKTVLNGLTEYAVYHFAAEEYWMGVHDYPKASQHREEHDIFTNKIRGFQDDFYNGTTNQFLEVMQFLKNWLANHILKSDADYGFFVKQHLHEITLTAITWRLPERNISQITDVVRTTSRGASETAAASSQLGTSAAIS